MVLPKRPLWLRERILLWRRKHLLSVARQAELSLSHALLFYPEERLQAQIRLDNIARELSRIADMKYAQLNNRG